ncbi:MAG: sulfotransferase family 2 domain-containing protein [Acidimicrobiales bacterium]|nr:sulfotransferase family 2 domain-containing protein [Acidimicrobiales bacterium]
MPDEDPFAPSARIRTDLAALKRDVALLGRHVDEAAGRARRLERRRSAGRPDAVFLHVPKSAGSSIIEAMQAAGGRHYLDVGTIRAAFPQQGIACFSHISYLDLREAGLVSEDYARRAFTFTVVRDPFDRAVSLFHYLIRHEKLPSRLTFALFSELLVQGLYEPIGLYNVLGLSQCAPQVTWLRDRDGELMADLVGRFEDLEPLVRELRERGIVAGELGHANASAPRRDTSSYYRSAEVRRNVEEAYRADLEAFGA